jgi:hypothetical protein
MVKPSVDMQKLEINVSRLIHFLRNIFEHKDAVNKTIPGNIKIGAVFHIHDVAVR